MAGSIVSIETGGSGIKGSLQKIGEPDSLQHVSIGLPGNPRSLGEEKFGDNIQAWMREAKLNHNDARHVFLAVAGYDTPEDLLVIEKALHRVGLTSETSRKREIHNDLAMGIAPYPEEEYPLRASAIVGTGTNIGIEAYGLGRMLVAGGTGALLSDGQGGGFGVGHRALQFAANAILDATMELGPQAAFEQLLEICPTLAQRVCKELDLHSMNDVIGITVPSGSGTWGDNVQRIAKAGKIAAEEALKEPSRLTESELKRGDAQGIREARASLAAAGEYVGGRFAAAYGVANKLTGYTNGHLTLLGSVIRDENGDVRAAFIEKAAEKGVPINAFTIDAFADTEPLHTVNIRRIEQRL